MAIATTSPVAGEGLRSFDELTPEELEDKLARAAAAAASYRLTDVEQRAEWLQLPPTVWRGRSRASAG
ncbi:hypothetical protein [Streptomyces sp. NPDC003710]